MGHGPDQQRLNSNPIEPTPEEAERLRRLALQWTLEEAEEDFERLLGETLAEFLEERERYLRDLEAFGPALPREPCEAWKMMNGQSQLLTRKLRQLPLPLDRPKPSL